MKHDLNEAIERKYNINEASFHGMHGLTLGKKASGKHTRDWKYIEFLKKQILKATNNDASAILTAVQNMLNVDDVCDFLEQVSDQFNLDYNYDEFDK